MNSIHLHYCNCVAIIVYLFFKGLNKNELNGTGIITDFNLDPQNYVFNPIKGELNRLNISFKKFGRPSGFFHKPLLPPSLINNLTLSIFK